MIPHAIRLFIAAGVLFLLILSGSFSFARADELDGLNKQIAELENSLQMSQNATRPLESELNRMRSQITQIRGRLAQIESDLKEKRVRITKGYEDIASKTELLHAKIRSSYITTSTSESLSLFLSLDSAQHLATTLAYQQAIASRDKAVITNLALSIADLEEKKKTLESEESRLAKAKTSLDTEAGKLDTIVAGAKAYQATLSSQIATLTQRQQELLRAKYDSLGIPLSAYNTQGGCVSDLVSGKDPGFSPRFGFFSFGVPNRVGLNQYGAKGRAEAGQNYEQILRAYYNADITRGYRTDIQIRVSGRNEYGQSFDTNWNIEEYVKHIYEVPTNWHPEVLKAQAIAARSYALAYTNDGGQLICPSQQCQVVKQELNSQSWIDAVEATRGMVLTSGGRPVSAWFSSTHGGYVYTSADIGWSQTSHTKRALDTTGPIASFGDLLERAYDRSSPWFYCNWGSRREYNSTAWLKSEEVADIINTMLLARVDGSTGRNLVQTDKPNPDGAETWSSDRVKQELRSRTITPFDHVESLFVSADFTTGKVSQITVNGNAPSQTIDGMFFKERFNLRAPANIQIVGPLFNVEKR